ncbi:unnamed protein product [Spodoptera littoralis]|uniref:THAP-type domain-containing protein n=1 Tax=Spodoptera littoralis TaxID=7109 RepID=A0A9P0I6L3_SPOLI|nr:unnamed protein product [Spodoptera littoralis]CAH1642038.1 unnamed protein product [Spodoptera littoralis]
MVQYCFICKWRADKEPRRSFHKFPSKESEKQKWLSIIGKSGVNIGKRTSVCSIHFEKCCFRYGLVNNREILKPDCVPSLHLTKAIETSKPLMDIPPELSIPESSLQDCIDENYSDISASTYDELQSNDVSMTSTKNSDVSPSLVVDSNDASHKKTRESAIRRNNRTVVCPECSTDINVEDKQKEKTNAVLVNAYQYFANECPELTRAQLRQRTAQCTGANEADVECALRIHWSQNADSDTPYGPSHKRRRIQNQDHGEESQTLYVEVEVQPGEYDEDSEEDPLSSEDEDIKPDVTETCIQQTTFIVSEDIKKETVESEDGVS